MLSQEIYESWEIQSKHDIHVQQLLERIRAPSIPNNASTLEGQTFRRSVVDRLEKRKLDELRENTDPDSRSRLQFLDWCCCKKKSEHDDDIDQNWRRIDCKNIDQFKSLMEKSVNTNSSCIRYVRGISSTLSAWEDPDPAWDGLSIIGCYIWLLSFAVQHLIDVDDPKGPMLPGVPDIRDKFTQIAQSGEIFAEMVERFHQQAQRVRIDAILIVKKMTKKWKWQGKNPFSKRPEVPQYKMVTPKRRIGKGLSEYQDEGGVFQENVFALNWTPLTVMMSSPDIPWKSFGLLVPEERSYWFEKFTQKALDILEQAAEDLTFVTGHLSSIDTTGELNSSKSHAREISGALLQFAKKSSVPKDTTPKEREELRELVCHFWYAADITDEEVKKLRRVVLETRDIIRTCYVYMDTFYKWNLPSYDIFLTMHKAHALGGTRTISNIRSIWDKFITQEPAERKLSDISAILVMMDFSTSAYQNILLIRPIEADGIHMKLQVKTVDMDDKLGFGLVSGTDKRKSSTLYKYGEKK